VHSRGDEEQQGARNAEKVHRKHFAGLVLNWHTLVSVLRHAGVPRDDMRYNVAAGRTGGCAAASDVLRLLVLGHGARVDALLKGGATVLTAVPAICDARRCFSGFNIGEEAAVWRGLSGEFDA
jgi:hypothetical protein